MDIFKDNIVMKKMFFLEFLNEKSLLEGLYLLLVHFSMKSHFLTDSISYRIDQNSQCIFFNIYSLVTVEIIVSYLECIGNMKFY
jgi:hypothetical protein